MMQKKTGIITGRTKGFYYLRDESGRMVECKIKGQLFKNSRFDNQAAVGDRVSYQKDEKADVGLIVQLEPRKSFLSRARVGKETEQVIAANIDYLFIVAATRQPAFRNNLINRMLVAASIGQVEPVLVVTKMDLAEKDEVEQLIEPFRDLGMSIFFSSTRETRLDDELLDLLSNHVSVLAGQSGTGKSSLLNKYFPTLSVRIGDVSAKTGKGSHTTTYSVMHQIADNGFVIDTPGIREFGLWDINQANLAENYPRISEFRHQCKHRNCRHIHEPQCAVKEAVAEGSVHRVLYDGYVSIYESLPSS